MKKINRLLILQSNMRFIVLLIILQFSTPLYSQQTIRSNEEVYQIFQRVLEAYKSNQLLSYQVNYQYFDNLTSSVPTDQLVLSIHQKEENVYLQSKEGDVLYVDGIFLMANHSDKQILVNTNAQAPQRLIGLDIELLAKLGKKEGLSLSSFPISDQLAGLRFEAPEQGHSTMEFVYDKVTYLLSYVHLKIAVADDFAYYLQGMQNTQIRVDYSNYQKRTAPFPFRIQDYVDQQQTTARYKAYELIVQPR